MVVVRWIEPMKHFKRNVLYWSERVFVVKARLCATSYFPQSWTNMFEKRANMCSLEETGSNREQLQRPEEAFFASPRAGSAHAQQNIACL